LAIVFCAFACVNAGLISVQEFQKCAAVFGYGTPSAAIANAFINQAQSSGGITSKLEAFMAVAQLGWESAGFSARSEWACSGGRWSAWPCDSYDTNGCPAGKKYYGRGFIQLTHCYNYKAAANALNNQNIVNNPDSVANDDNLAMGTALWFWKSNVHNANGVQQGQFGSATRAINGGLECAAGGDRTKANARYQKFQECLSACGATGLGGSSAGC